MKKNFTLVLLFLSTLCSAQQFSQKFSDINYAGDGRAYHNLDIYLPRVVKSSYPVVIYVYGSAWMSNNSKGADMSTIGSALLDAGFAVVTPNHRSSSDAIFPAQINDIKAVVRFLRGNSTMYKLDTSFIGISGSSSGGHLSALTGTSNFVNQYTVGTATANIEGTVGNFRSYRSDVHAVGDWFGPTDFLKMDSCGSQLNHNASNSPESSLIGGPIQNNKDKVALANPITYVDPTDPPFLIIHGNQDALVPHCESQFLYNALQRENVESEYILVPGGGHGGSVTQSAANINTMVEFFLSQVSTITSSEPKVYAVDGLKYNVYSTSNGVLIRFISQEKVSNYELLDMSGRKISDGAVQNNEVNISSLNTGIYIFKGHLENGELVTRRILLGY